MPSKPDYGSVRIIAGEWRSRRLPVIDLPGLRPSGDRARETLFNWLQAYLPGATCADLFAGTGALGFEAASRGAEKVSLIERDSKAVQHLRESVGLLKAEQVDIHHEDAITWLKKQAADSLNIIFVDPPFQDRMHSSVMSEIVDSNCLGPGGFVYLETPVTQTDVIVPSGWSVWREKVLGDVRLQVFRQ
jgi:16S rRNA (guanine966-N2)-methyltransferase